ncbi:hypothetical protein HNR06_000029 [Nocardiopsis arvandica]|uniref:Uncharacterized protein n=1 Tax=Nocardiopsis sinuspersici TaxID=501010 RepID=A0A7Y9X914_9ACTN|nr:hypothetical protein [Nocardiopsis sinuspersici]NYH50440.1 hypothetical protein [Nocardiopsis sinuspersici]
MSAEPVSSGVRAVLDAPRGRRFSRPGAPAAAPLTREQRLLIRMEGNPRVAHRMEHGELPAWMHVHAARVAERDSPTPEGPRKPSTTPDRPQAPTVPRPRSAPDDSPIRHRPERPPLPRRPRRPHSHRKPRRFGWRLTGYTLAALAGALAHHLTAGLL